MRRTKRFRSIAATAVIGTALMFVVGQAPLGSAGVRPASTAAASATSFTGIPVTGTTSDGGTFTGTLNVTNFVATSTGLKAVGTLSGTLTNAAGDVIGSVVDQVVKLRVRNMSGTCQILHLELGPLDLDLLGLQVHLDKVVLDITAQAGPGNLLGNLLCAVAGLLDNGGALSAVTNLLNQIIARL